MDIRSIAGDAPDLVDGPSARQVLTYLEGVQVDGADSQVAVLAVLAVQVARAVDRSASTGVAASTLPNLVRQMRETLAELRELLAPLGVHEDPFTVAQTAALAAASHAGVDGVTPSLFTGGV